MVTARRGYWDVERCAWVMAEPRYVGPPTRTGEPAGPAADAPVDPAPVTGELPAPREAESRPVATDRA